MEARVVVEVTLLLLSVFAAHAEGRICNVDLDPLPFDCQEAYDLGCRRSGVYTIDPGCGKAFSVWCDMKNGGGWTVFQRRRDGSVNFNQGWIQYENGFGDVNKEHWLGLKKINCLTSVPMRTKLRVDLADFAGHSKYASYDYFYVGNPGTDYKLSIGGYQSWAVESAGDSITGSYSLNGLRFSTHDRDNDKSSNNCAANTQGAWWHRSCTQSHLNGLYLAGESNSNNGFTWYRFNATAPSWNTLRYSEMKLRRCD